MKKNPKTRKKRAAHPKSVPLEWFRLLPTPFFLLDASSRIVYANDAFIELTAYSASEIVGARFDTLFDPLSMRAGLKSLLGLYQGKPVTNEAYDLLRKTGSKTHVVVNVTPIYGRGLQRVTNAMGIVLVQVKI